METLKLDNNIASGDYKKSDKLIKRGKKLKLQRGIRESRINYFISKKN